MRNIVLAIVGTDRTFKKVSYGSSYAWQGKCIFCNKKILVGEQGNLIEHTTVEHIIPRSRGGTDDIKNLALACKYCNWEKGRRHDRKRRNNGQRALEIIEKLQKKRIERWRDNE